MSMLQTLGTVGPSLLLLQNMLKNRVANVEIIQQLCISWIQSVEIYKQNNAFPDSPYLKN